MLGARGPDFLAVDDVVVVAFAPRGGAQGERVGARGRFRDAEGLQAQFAAGDLRQIVLLLLGAAMPQDRAHRIHLRVAGSAVAAGRVHFLEDRGGPAAGPLAGGELVRVGTGFTHDSFTSSIHLGATWARPWSIAITSRSTTRARKLTTPRSLSLSRQNSVRMVSPGNTGAENRPALAV